MSTVNWTPKFKNANGDEVELILGVDQVANSDGTPLAELITNMGETIDGITAEDVGARPDTWMPTASEVGAPTTAELDSVKDDLANFMPVYTDLAQIGITTGSETIDSIMSALPKYSALNIAITGSHNASIYPMTAGSMFVRKTWSGRARFEFYSADNTRKDLIYFALHNGTSFTGWIELGNKNGYLPLTGGMLSSNAQNPLLLNSLDPNATTLSFQNNGAYWGHIGCTGVDDFVVVTHNGTAKKLYGEHNITKGTSALTANSSALATGYIYLQYE